MPQLTIGKHEQFCLAMAAGRSMTQAARLAGYGDGSAPNIGSRLCKQPHIRNRIEELKADSAETLNALGKPWIVTETVGLYRLAMVEKQFAVSLQAIQFLAKLGGHLVDRRESYSAKVNIHALRPGELGYELAQHLKALPDAERAQILEAEPELTQVIEPIGELTTQEHSGESAESTR